MFPLSRFRPTHQALLLAMIAAAYPVLGYSAAGRLDFVIGRVTAVGADGKERALLKGSEIDAGDAVNTGADGRAQIRFSDGAFVSLQPGTTFRVDQYRYAGKTDGSEKGFFSLLKGGLRTITGAIGHGKNQDAYQVATPAATIGIRGTGYNAQLGNSLTVSVGEGAIALLNNGGLLILNAGQTGFVQDFNTAPQLTFEKPSTPPVGLAPGGQEKLETKYAVGDNLGGGVGSTILTGVTGVMSRDSNLAFGGVTIGGDIGGTMALDSSFNRVYYQDSSGTITNFSGAILDKTASGSFPSYGYDGVVGWGRWYGTLTFFEGGVTTTLSTTSANGMHGVAGLPTATLPTVGYATYSLSGATRPTDGTNVGFATGGSISVYFGATPSLFGSYSYSLGGTPYSLSFSVTDPHSWVGGVFGVNNATISGGACGGTASVVGFFAGANAERIGMSFKGTVGFTTQNGAAVYSKTSYSASGPL